MKPNGYVKIFIMIGILFLFYSLGFPIQTIIILGIFMILLMIFKTKFYKKIDKIIREKIPSVSKLPEWTIRLIIIATFILLYILIKQAVFEILKLLGFDIKQMMLDSMNQSVK